MLLSLLIAAPLGGNVITVDAAGGGDATEITEAIALALPGDLLFVLPGDYAPFTLVKELTILADPANRPKCGTSAVRGATSFVLRGLQFEELLIETVTGRGRIDDCAIVGTDTTSPPLFGAALTVTDTAELEVLRSSVQGLQTTQVSPCQPGVQVTDSLVSFTDCSLIGGSPVTFGAPIDGCTGVNIGGDSTVIVAGCNIAGSSGSLCGPGGCGEGGYGLRTFPGAKVDIRGTSANTIVGGLNGDFLSNQLALSGPGILYGGVTLSGGTSATVGFIDPPLPYLSIEQGAGALWTFSLHGPLGQPLLLALASEPGSGALAGLEGLLWIDPGSVFGVLPLLSLGQDTPFQFSVTMPSVQSLFGTNVLAQGFWQQPGSVLSSNPATLVLEQ